MGMLLDAVNLNVLLASSPKLKSTEVFQVVYLDKMVWAPNTLK